MQSEIRRIVKLMSSNTTEDGELPVSVGIEVATLFSQIDETERAKAWMDIYTQLKRLNVPTSGQFTQVL